MISYSKQIKNSLLETVPKKKCCQRIQEDVIRLSTTVDSTERAAMIAALSSHFKCSGCKSRALAIMFVVFGSVTDPEKQYHLEFSFDTEEERAAAKKILDMAGFDMRSSVRKGKLLLYVKDSNRIQDFFALAGANKAAFDFINVKIIHEVRGDANRQINCDMANINKTIAAAEQLAEMIEEMREKNYIQGLPKELQETAVLRLENTQASIAELGALHNPPISKSGVKHRLDKIKDYYIKFKSEQ